MLASTSPYRRALLERLRLPFEIKGPHVDESPLAGESARDIALRLAQEKARAVAPFFPRSLVIGCDQVATLDGTCLGKPGNHANAVAQLASMRGREVLFHTALALVNTENSAAQTAEVPTVVRFRNYSDSEIERYLELEQPYDCAGSAKIEALGIVLVDRVTGEDPSALIGLPLIRLAEMLRREGVAIV